MCGAGVLAREELLGGAVGRVAAQYKTGMFFGAGGLMLLVAISLHSWAQGFYSTLALGLLLRVAVGSIIVGLLRLAGFRTRSVARRPPWVTTALLIALAVAISLPFWWVRGPALLLGLLVAIYLRRTRDEGSI